MFQWIPEVRHYCKDTPIIIVGTKTDLRTTSEHALPKERGVKLASQEKTNRYLECSALKNVSAITNHEKLNKMINNENYCRKT